MVAVSHLDVHRRQVNRVQSYVSDSITSELGGNLFGGFHA